MNQEDMLLPGYPATVEGQTRYLKDMLQIIREVPGAWAMDSIIGNLPGFLAKKSGL